MNSGVDKIYDPDYIKNLLNDFYNALLNKTGDIKIGKCTIDDDERQYFRSRISLLSENTIKMMDKNEVGV